MKKKFPIQKILLGIILLLPLSICAQVKVGDNPTNVNPDAVLEIESTDKGMLLPRIALTSTAASAPLSAHVAGMTVYNTATAGDVTPGYYYNDGVRWVRLIDFVEGEPWFDQATNTEATNNTQNIYQMGNVAVRKNTNYNNGGNSPITAAFDVEGAIRTGTLPEGNVGANSVAMGTRGVASGNASVALGSLNQAIGNSSMALGFRNTASSLAEVSVGSKNFNLGGSATTWVATDPLFTVGNSDPDQPSIRHNALTMLKNAHTGIGIIASGPSTAKPTEMLDIGSEGVRIRDINTAEYTGVSTNRIVVADTNGVLKTIDAATLAPSSTEPWFDQATNTEATLNTQNIYQSGNVAIGKDNNYDNAGASSITAALDVQGAVRTGTGHQGDVGIYSVAFGEENIASGDWSFAAAGLRNHSTGGSSVTLGQDNTASGDLSIAIGSGNFATGGWDVAIGESNHTNAPFSAALGVSLMNPIAGSTVVGSRNAIRTTTGDPSNIVGIDPAFQVGIGRSTDFQNGITVLFNGNTAIGVIGEEADARPTERLDIGLGTADADNKGSIRIRAINTPDYAGNISTDKVVVADEDGVLKTVDASDITAGVTASNGVNIGGGYEPGDEGQVPGTENDVMLGGALIYPTTITASAFNTLAIAGLVEETDADLVDIAVVDKTTGVLKTLPVDNLAIEPWQVQGTTDKATENTQNIYQMGKVGIGTDDLLGTTNPDVMLAVNGAIITTTSIYADYVFEDYFEGHSGLNENYAFKSLGEVEKFINENRHLPGITKIDALMKNEKGEYIINATQLSIQVLEKVEELFLHTIEQQNHIEKQQKHLEQKDQKIQDLENRLERLEKLLIENKD